MHFPHRAMRPSFDTADANADFTPSTPANRSRHVSAALCRRRGKASGPARHRPPHLHHILRPPYVTPRVGDDRPLTRQQATRTRSRPRRRRLSQPPTPSEPPAFWMATRSLMVRRAPKIASTSDITRYGSREGLLLRMYRDQDHGGSPAPRCAARYRPH